MDLKCCCCRSLVVLLLMSGHVAVTQAANSLSNEVYVNKQWHDLDATTSTAVNPSFVARVDWPTFSTALSATQMGLFYLVNAQATIPLSPRAYNSHTIGFGYTGLNAGTVRPSHWKNGAVVVGEHVAHNTYGEHYGSMVYAFMPFEMLAVGATVTIARQSNFNRPITDGAIDVGTSLSLTDSYFGTHIVGISLLNPARLSRYDLPVFTPDACVSWHFEKKLHNLDIRGGFEANYRSFRGENYGSPQREAAARIGAAVNNSVSCYLQGGRRYFGVTLHVALDSSSARIPEFMRKVTGACQVLFTEEQMRPTSTLYFSGEMKRNRNVVSGDAYDIYLKAVAAMAAEKWVDAYALFVLLDKEEPVFPKIDEVRLYTATCLEKMHLYRQSASWYKTVQKRFRYHSSSNVSKILGGASLGLLRIYAKSDDSAAFAREFLAMHKIPMDDSIWQHALYTAGLWTMSGGDTAGAIELFSQVRADHPDFPFAQFSKGVCHVVTNDADRLIEKSLKEAVEYDGPGGNAKEIGYRACYRLACFYYEQNRFADAQRYIERIPEESTVYYEGLSVVSWSLMKSRQWNRCRIVAKEMQKSYSADIQAEGYLLEGYALMCDTLCPQSKLICLSHARKAADKASRLLQSIDIHRQTDTKKLARENDSLAAVLWELLERYHGDLGNSKEHAYLFKSIDKIRSPANYCQYRTDINLLNSDLARHYYHNQEHLSRLKDDINYFSAKVTMLYERERARSVLRHDVSER